ncbi:Zinc/iron permease [Amylocarpus encephaloides]|uniref:Zinc/iron permease n=1 Tax=Amylocarpus encephaloides TaxID=45428 RepID=A0A9P8CA33_9HELO|nr:Zinc/iron permease [Amylocarpus encephaloides]
MTPTVEVECDSGNDYDGRMGLRISSIFVIGLGSMLGALLPVAAARTRRMRVPKLAFFITKHFGSGVIITTAFIHLLSPANEALNNPCNTGSITDYDWAQGIALMTVFVMFFIELMAARFDLFGRQAQDVEASTPAKDLVQNNEKSPPSKGNDSSEPSDSITAGGRESSIPGRQDDFTYPPGGEDHLGHQREHMTDDEHFAAQMTGLFILEFGVIFHSVFIGLTLAVTGEEFVVLYIVLVFHQTFEGLGLGSRLATAAWPKAKWAWPWVLGAAYGLTTPIAIAVGLGVRQTLEPNSETTRVVNGVFDAISAGILIYTGLVELMAHEFMFNPEMRKASMKMLLLAYLCMCVGAGLMALLGKWA